MRDSAIRHRLVLVYNPRSSGFKQVEDEVITPLRQQKNLTLLKFTVQPTNVDDNAAHLARILRAGDLVLAAGGDGTATIALNGVVQAEQRRRPEVPAGAKSALAKSVATQAEPPIRLAVLGYGNFNDFARTLGRYDFTYVTKQFFQADTSVNNQVDAQAKQASAQAKRANIPADTQTETPTRPLYPLEIRVNGRHWRYAASYLTVGLFAESTQVFDQPAVREFLQKHGKNLFFSVWALARWYFQNRKREFIPTGKLNGRLLKPGTTDLLMVSSKSVAKVMRGGRAYLDPQNFWLSTARLGSFWRLVWFMLRSILHRLPGQATSVAQLEFAQPVSLELQAEGEYQKFTEVRKIEVRKVSAVECLVKK